MEPLQREKQGKKEIAIATRHKNAHHTRKARRKNGRFLFSCELKAAGHFKQPDQDDTRIKRDRFGSHSATNAAGKGTNKNNGLINVQPVFAEFPSFSSGIFLFSHSPRRVLVFSAQTI